MAFLRGSRDRSTAPQDYAERMPTHKERVTPWRRGAMLRPVCGRVLGIFPTPLPEGNSGQPTSQRVGFDDGYAASFARHRPTNQIAKTMTRTTARPYQVSAYCRWSWRRLTLRGPGRGKPDTGTGLSWST